MNQFAKETSFVVIIILICLIDIIFTIRSFKKHPHRYLGLKAYLFNIRLPEKYQTSAAAIFRIGHIVISCLIIGMALSIYLSRLSLVNK